MPVEINELVIKASINADPSRQAAIPVSDHSQKIQQILDAFLSKLEKKKER